MDSSGKPVSKYRGKVFVPGRPEYILIFGAPTYFGHREILSDTQSVQLNGSYRFHCSYKPLQTNK
jgi:hypothetical protein